MMPNFESSKTRHCSGALPNRFAASLKIIGSGLEGMPVSLLETISRG